MKDESFSKETLEIFKKDRDPNIFIGFKESEFFEAKRFESYKREGGTFENREVAKDISAMANSDLHEGCIIFGLETKEDRNLNIDVVENISPLQVKDDSYENKIKSIVKENIYPDLTDDKNNFLIEWIETKTGFFMIIYIQGKQDAVYITNEKSRERNTSHITFSIYKRQCDNNNPFELRTLQSIFKKASNNELSKINERLLLLEELIRSFKLKKDSESQITAKHLLDNINDFLN
jgi:hypothetical protein